MLYNEIYGAYYHLLGRVLEAARQGELTPRRLAELASQYGYSDSLIEVEEKFRTAAWPLIDKEYHTPIENTPRRPLTLLELRWIKTVLQDPRCRLFLEETADWDRLLSDIEPLYLPSDIVYYDQYTDGDPYEDDRYIARFRIIRKALHTHQGLRIAYENRRGALCEPLTCTPLYLEYSQRDDRFQLYISPNRQSSIINVGQIHEVSLVPTAVAPLDASGKAILSQSTSSQTAASQDAMPAPSPAGLADPQLRTLVLAVTNENNALERLLIQTSHYQTEAERQDDLHYVVTIQYDPQNETDLLIQLLSFGPHIEIREPDSLREAFIRRVQRQMQLFGM